MPFDFYCGRPGSGKSYGVVENVIVPAFKQGRDVVTNLPLVVDELRKAFPESPTRLNMVTNEEITPEFLLHIQGQTPFRRPTGLFYCRM